MRSIHRILALAGALAIAAPSLPAYAQNAPTKAQQQEAATRFKKGLELFRDGDYQAALIEFRRANELAPNFNVLYNIGQVYFQLQDYPNALNALERYLSEGGSNIPSSRRADVQRDIDKLHARVANMEFLVTVPDADVAIDDIVVGKSPLPKPIMVSAGRHKITVSKTGFTATTKVVEIASGDSLKVPIDPIEQKVAPILIAPDPTKPAEVVNVTPQPEPPVLPAPPPPKSTPVAGIVITSGLAVGAVITGVLALGAKSSLQTEVASPSATRDSLDSAHSKMTGFALATDILVGSAVVAFGVTLYVGLSGPSKKDTPAPRASGAAAPPAQPASLPTLRVGFGADGAKLFGTF